mmetsp:Transcript_6310/g.21143  ORF Transcript_6310/g.21143 Transcript_6310/m.21143 type:complete len:417 (+) Transcript_6310:1114-2364(+)
MAAETASFAPPSSRAEDALASFVEPVSNPRLYKESHHKFRAKVRAFCDKEIRPYIDDWEEEGTYPSDLHKKAYEAGVYAAVWPEEYGGTPPEGGLDAFHDLIFFDEVARLGSGGLMASCFISHGIALPPVIAAGSPEMKEKVARPVITGEKLMALCISEPWVGSDVASLRSSAVRDGDHYVVNGAKKWITGGIKADYYTVAVRTGGPGIGGISLLLIERNTPGISVRRMKTQGWWVSNTAYIEFNDVRVPAKNLIGAENKGFQLIMENFNHERWGLAVTSIRYARLCLEAALSHASTRKTFGKRLIEHQVIRHKCAEMKRQIEMTHALMEQVTEQMNANVPQKELGGQIALMKVAATRTFELCAREASQVFGGNSYIREGKGAIVERLYREVRVQAIGGGSEEIMYDLWARGLSKL